jgi:lipopolysaccharide transport system ATP-binding protein
MKDVSTGEGRTVLFVSHNLRAMSALCDRSILLEGGMLKSDGLPADIISNYLTVKDTKEIGIALVESTVNKELPAQILSVWLENAQGNKCSNFQLHEPYYLCMVYEVRKELDHFAASFQIFTEMNELLMVTIDLDEINATKDIASAGQPRGPGRYHCRVKIPSPLLNGGQYSVKANIMQPRRKLFDTLDGPRFSIDDIDTFASSVSLKTRGGNLAVPLKWEVSGC